MARMKIDSSTFTAIAEKIAPLDTPERRAMYAERDPRIPNIAAVQDIDRRYRWDLFYAARAYFVVEGDRITDNHIDTALRRIVPPLEDRFRPNGAVVCKNTHPVVR